MGLEKYLIPSYLFGTKKEIKDHKQIDFINYLKHRRLQGEIYSDPYIFGRPHPMRRLVGAQFFASIATLIAGRETDSNLYSIVGLYLAADYGWRFLQAIVDNDYGTECQPGLIGTVRRLYKKLKQ